MVVLGCRDVDETDAWIEVGTGTRAFQPLTDGAPITIEAGLQGGYHVTGALRAAGPDDHPVPIRFSLSLDGEEIGAVDTYLALEPGPDEIRQLLRVPVFLWDAPQPIRVAGQTLTMSVWVDWEGRVLHDSVDVRPTW